MSRIIVCPSCKGSGGPINWMWRVGSINYNVPCPTCAATGYIVDRRTKRATAPPTNPLCACGEPLTLAHLEAEREKYTAAQVAKWTVSPSDDPLPRNDDFLEGFEP